MTNDAPPPQGVTTPPAHKIARDGRGYFCLNCAWPGENFTHLGADADAHAEGAGA